MTFTIECGATAPTLAATLLLWYIVLTCAYAGGRNTAVPDTISIVNDLDACLRLEQHAVEMVGLTTKLFLTGTLIAKTGSCGCPSRLVSYTVLETISTDERPVAYERAYGILFSPNGVNDKKQFELTLKSDSDISYTGKVSLHIACKSPD